MITVLLPAKQQQSRPSVTLPKPDRRALHFRPSERRQMALDAPRLILKDPHSSHLSLTSSSLSDFRGRLWQRWKRSNIGPPLTLSIFSHHRSLGLSILSPPLYLFRFGDGDDAQINRRRASSFLRKPEEPTRQAWSFSLSLSLNKLPCERTMQIQQVEQVYRQNVCCHWTLYH